MAPATKIDVEEVKRRKPPLTIIEDIERYAKTGFASIEPEHFPLFRWYGLYQQMPNADGFFMQRVKVPNGQLNANQVREVGKIANEFARGIADITTRQTFQFHWLTIDKMPEIYRRLHYVGLTSAGACGDAPRNVVGCPLAGVDANEIIDATPVLRHVATFLTGNSDFGNLPRKYKISISGCRLHCAQPEINCVGVYGAERIVNGKKEAGFGLMVGGGLSTRPYFGADMGVFLTPEEVFRAVIAVSEIFRDSDVLRQDRIRARLKFLMHDPKIGLGPEKFKALIEEKLGHKMTPGGPYAYTKHAETDHLGIRPQKQPGLSYVGVGVRVGRLKGDELLRIADIAEEFSIQASVRTTNKQNFVITDVPNDKLSAMEAKLQEAGLDYHPTVFKRSLVSCTGKEFCNLAITETKEFGAEVSRYLDKRFPNAEKPVRIHFSGCPNNCGQNAIADIGLRGGMTKVNGVMVDAFDILVGGTTGEARAFGEVASKKVPATQLAEAIGNLYEAFLGWSKNGEVFQDFVKEHSKEQLDAIARGNPIPSAEAVA